MAIDIAGFQLGGEWLEMNIEGGLSLKVLVKPLSDKEQIQMSRSAKKEDMAPFLDEVKALVLDWDLMEGKNSLKCNDGNKKKYLPYLINMKVEQGAAEQEDEENEEEDSVTVGVSILKFAQTFSNFIKN